MIPPRAEGRTRLFSAVYFQKLGSIVSRILVSSKFFYWVVGILAFQSLWIALSARYPQAFDENYHLGLIQLHAKQWLPFFTSQPAHAEIYGPAVRDGSYFYHYLLSIPYRGLTHLTSSLTVQVIILRLFNIAMFVWGLFVYRELLNRLQISTRLRNVVLLFFVLTPIVPLLASQINYDNLIFPLTGLLFLYTVRYLDVLRNQDRIHSQLLVELILYGLFAGIVKYSSLPLFFAVMVIVSVATARFLRGRRPTREHMMTFTRKWVLVLYALLLVIIGGLFLERYAINLVRFHSPAPNCAVILNEQLCKSYSPWARDNLFSQTLPHPSIWGEIVYPFVWIHRMVFETMFLISSRFEADGLVSYIPAPPLTVANYTAWIVVIVGFVLAVYFIRKLRAMTDLWLLLLSVAFYVAMLLIRNFLSYVHSGEAVSIHGRYLVPMYPILYLVLALGYAWGLQKIQKPQWKPWLVILILLGFSQGAGLVGWIYRSDPSWYWFRSSNALVYEINRPVQTVVHHIVIP